MYLELSSLHVGSAAALIAVNAGISMAFRLGLEKSLLIASLRTIAQLVLIGWVLQWVFSQHQLYVVLALVLAMTAVAGWTAASRVQWVYRGLWLNTVLSMWISSWVIGSYAVLVILQGIEPWYQAQYVIPIMGMILGNTLNGISIGIDSLLEAVSVKRLAIESRLALGANRWEAVAPELRRANHAGMTPIINSMMVVGLVTLPGMMTGQLLAGASPLQAIRYQIVIMFVIASATALGTLCSTMLACRRLLNSQHQLESWRVLNG